MRELLTRLLASLILLAAAVVLLALVTKSDPTGKLLSLGHSTVRIITRGRRTLPTVWALLLGLLVWVTILLVVIAVVYYFLLMSGRLTSA
jgi:hypothetical protein